MSDSVHPASLNSRPKVLLVGSTGVGKTSVLLRYTGHGFSATQTPTIGAGFSVCSVPITRVCCGDDAAASSSGESSAQIELGVWDTAGQERYRAMMPLYYRNAAAAVVMYDVTAAETLEMAKLAHTDLMRYAPGDVVLCVAGNKVDMLKKREVAENDGLTFAKSISADFCETSALTGVNVEQLFCTVARRLVERANVNNDKTAKSDAGHLVLSARHDGVAHAHRQKRTCCTLI